jgi:hypothetical protein
MTLRHQQSGWRGRRAEQKPARLNYAVSEPFPSTAQPVADAPTGDAAEAAYRAMCADLEGAWRKQA